MAFDQVNERIPTTLWRLKVILEDVKAPGAGETTQAATYEIVLLDQNNRKLRFPAERGQLAPHLTHEEISQLQAFMATLRARAEEQLLPPPPE